MEQTNGNERRSVLIEKKLIDNAGTVNTFTVNCISGAHTWPLLSEAWDLYQNDVASMEELKTFLNEVYEKGECDILIGILKILYSFCGLLIPDAIQMIFDCDERELKEIYLYEFLEDFQDIMYDSRTPPEIYEKKIANQELYAALNSLSDKQARRIYAHYFLGMSKYAIAKAESVNESAVRRSIEAGVFRMGKILKNQ